MGQEDPSGAVPARVADPLPTGATPRWRRAWRWWLGKSALIIRRQNRVIGLLGYYLGLGPVALFMRWRGEDHLDRARKPVGGTGWHERTEPIATDPMRIRRPF
jgi:hypothetical protein